MSRRFTDAEVRMIAEAYTAPAWVGDLQQRFAEAGADHAAAMAEAVGQLRAGEAVELGGGTFLACESLKPGDPLVGKPIRAVGAVRMAEVENPWAGGATRMVEAR